MLQYLVRRLTQIVLVVPLILMSVFFLSHLTGDPALLYLPIEAPEEMVVRYRELHGFNRPLIDQFATFATNALRLDFGNSLWLKIPASEVVLARLPYTLRLAVLTTVISLVVAVIMGSLAALHPLGWLDRLTNSFALLGSTLPNFWLGMLLILLFAVRLHWLPTSGSTGWQTIVMPLITLSFRPIGRLAQVVRTAVLDQLGAQYVLAARARGVGMISVVGKHTLRNAALPVITVASDEFISLANGAVIIETVFGWPGIGKLALDAIQQRDFPVLLATITVVAIMVVLVNVIVDLLYAVADPRVRLR